ncbi:hypothetical protein ATDW_26640 [Asticcacaulis sp. DW145]|uniref:Uncharacterized protein n=1 Tax=Asticcacaulis currens TaxID=2984210 RepID=A0ABT5IFH1_9CAUL|nr:hypothetical protein [Asticcacaulis currens]MDC7694928.1 hypothetical protein [Asticcacaulis currens]BEV12168.1 hypothetical protein ATDW_26640 [Asticcacaulis sp. DW145]
MTIGMGILWGGLLGAPVLAYLVQRFGRPQNHTLLPLSFAVLAVVALAWAVGLRFTSPLANLMALALAYTAYAFLAWEGWGIGDKRIGLRMILKFVTVLPIVFGYFMATIGLLGLSFLFGDFTGKPGHAETLAPGIGCEIRTQSGGPSWGTTAVSVHRELTPFLRWERAHQRLSEEEAVYRRASDLCRDAYTKWQNS